ncbi:MAG: hypothetical protein QOE36_1237 [Gaiellaceae bacterium]|jgi:hypothetical protein|nr:hypothetical protein [Gaiellaceae bacterium]
MSTQEFEEEVEEVEEGEESDDSAAEEGEWESGGTVAGDDELGEGGDEQ